MAQMTSSDNNVSFLTTSFISPTSTWDVSPFFSSICHYSQDVDFNLRQFIFHKLNEYNKTPASLLSKELKPASKFHPEYPKKKNLYGLVAVDSSIYHKWTCFLFLLIFLLSYLNTGVLLSNPLHSHYISATFYVFIFLAVLTACRSFQAREQTHATVVTRATAVTMADP